LDKELDDTCARLMQAAQSGDKEAYRELLDRLYPRLLSFLKRRVADEHVEDVAHETLITMHRVRDTWDATRPFGPWLYALAHHRAQDWKRGAWRAARRQELGAELHESISLGKEVRAVEARVDLAAALERLSDRQKTIVSLLKLEDLSIAEVAERLSMTASAVKVAAHRAYEELRRLLTEKENGRR
jgi:RNA polymerase sigma-70 factor (ECF subfamily)